MKITAASQKVKRKALDPALDDSIDSEVNFVKLYCSNNISLHVIYSQNHLAANNRNESIFRGKIWETILFEQNFIPYYLFTESFGYE